MGNSKLEAGRYKMAFLDYLQKAEDLCRCIGISVRFKHFCDMQKAYGGKLISVLEYRKEFLAFCEMLRSKYGFTDDLSEALGRIEMDCEIKREEEEIAYRRLKKEIRACFGATDKVIQMCSSSRETMNLRVLLTEDEDASERRKCFWRLLKEEGNPISPLEMSTIFFEEIYATYNIASQTDLV